MTSATVSHPEMCCPETSPSIVWSGLNRFVTAIARWQTSKRDIRRLRGLSDHHLKDIGIHRSEICSVVYGQPCEDRRTRG